MLRRFFFVVLSVVSVHCAAQWPFAQARWFDTKHNMSPYYIPNGPSELEQWEKIKAAHVRTISFYDVNYLEDDTSKITCYYFDRNGNPVRYIRVAHPDTTKNFQCTTWQYNMRGQVVSVHDTDVGNITQYNYYYDEQGRPLQEKNIGRDGIVYGTDDLTYDDKGRLILITHWHLDTVEYREQFTWSDSGDMVSDIWYSTTGKIRSKMTFEYDKDHHVVRYNTFRGKERDTLSEYFTYAYDTAGRIIEMKVMRENGVCSMRNYYGYNESGQRIFVGRQGLYLSTEQNVIYNERGLETKSVNRSAGKEYYYLFTYGYYKGDTSGVFRNIFFSGKSGTLFPSSYPELDSMVTYLQEYPGAVIEISAHTDNQGREGFNQKLSENRAKSVAGYLIAKGIDQSRVTYHGYGGSRPAAPNDTEEGRRQNRRVEFQIRDK